MELTNPQSKAPEGRQQHTTELDEPTPREQQVTHNHHTAELDAPAPEERQRLTMGVSPWNRRTFRSKAPEGRQQHTTELDKPTPREQQVTHNHHTAELDAPAPEERQRLAMGVSPWNGRTLNRKPRRGDSNTRVLTGRTKHWTYHLKRRVTRKLHGTRKPHRIANLVLAKFHGYTHIQSQRILLVLLVTTGTQIEST